MFGPVWVIRVDVDLPAYSVQTGTGANHSEPRYCGTQPQKELAARDSSRPGSHPTWWLVPETGSTQQATRLVARRDPATIGSIRSKFGGVAVFSDIVAAQGTMSSLPTPSQVSFPECEQRAIGHS